MKRASFIVLCVITLTACGTSHEATEDNDTIRWPDFLRDWAAAEKIDDARQLAIIDQIDLLYLLIDDSTTDSELLCDKVCQLQETISDVIMYDSSTVFQLMIRATCRNIYGVLNNNPRLIEHECLCDFLNYLLLDAQWYTSSEKDRDMMLTTFMGSSWQAPFRFAYLMFGKEDGNDLAMSTMFVYNYTDTVINNLKIIITDSESNIIDSLTESDTYVDTSIVCLKRMHVPPYLIMAALADKGRITITYETPHGTVEMMGFPHVFFMKQIEDCPRLKEVLKQALSEQAD